MLGGVLVGSRMAGIAGWRVSSWQGIIFMDGFLSTRGGFLYGRVCLTLAFWYAWVGQGRVSDMLGWSWWDPEW